MPELPEVERARRVIADFALDRSIVAVDDSDSYVCRPHPPGELAAALTGRCLTAAHRRGKTMWCETSGIGRSRTAGPHLGLHLGMSGLILAFGADGRVEHGGEPFPGANFLSGSQWNRFSLDFSDGGRLVLFDKRRLARVRLEPDLSGLGTDAEHVTKANFSMALHGLRTAGSRVPVKARLLDQSVVAGIGNLLADEVLWQAAVDPRRPTDELTTAQIDRIHAALRRAISAATRKGGVHTGDIIPFRKAGANCPRCGAPMRKATLGGRSTWFCEREQS